MIWLFQIPFYVALLGIVFDPMVMHRVQRQYWGTPRHYFTMARSYRRVTFYWVIATLDQVGCALYTYLTGVSGWFIYALAISVGIWGATFAYKHYRLNQRRLLRATSAQT